MISEKQFKLLSFLQEHPQEEFTQRQLAEQLEVSLGTINSLLKEMKEAPKPSKERIWRNLQFIQERPFLS